MKRLRPRPRWRPLYAAGCRRGRTPNASQRDTRHRNGAADNSGAAASPY